MTASSNQPFAIASSILSADFSRLGDEVEAVSAAGVDWIHLDIMDGHFVPNITFGPAVVKAIRNRTDKIFDCHLMIAPVDAYLPIFADAGCDIITIHVEAEPHWHRSLQNIRNKLGKKAGLSINPATPLSIIEPFLDDIDLLLVMSVNPGFGGQAFIPETIGKIRHARALIGERPIDIEVDGGVTPDNAEALVTAGANILVAGSAVFRGNNEAAYRENIFAIRRAAQAA